MAAAIQTQTGHDCELLAGDRGVFDVSLDGSLMFSKHEEGRFPSEDEIVEKLR